MLFNSREVRTEILLEFFLLIFMDTAEGEIHNLKTERDQNFAIRTERACFIYVFIVMAVRGIVFLGFIRES